MIAVNRARQLTFGLPLILWLLFTFWYTNTEGPLTDAEIEEFLAFAAQTQPTMDATRVLTFMREDTGRQFVMVNILDMAAEPPPVTGAPPEMGAREMLDHYMEFMYPALLARASHPIFAGAAVAPAMDLDGIEGAEQWTTGALMRYRSRRDMLEIAMNPLFSERHEYKLAALEKTIAFPVEPMLYYADPRFLLALVLFSLAALIDLVFLRR